MASNRGPAANPILFMSAVAAPSGQAAEAEENEAPAVSAEMQAFMLSARPAITVRIAPLAPPAATVVMLAAGTGPHGAGTPAVSTGASSRKRSRRADESAAAVDTPRPLRWPRCDAVADAATIMQLLLAESPQEQPRTAQRSTAQRSALDATAGRHCFCKYGCRRADR
eukprot:jgi/Ulvmu1/6370/UM297_0002.1